MADQLTPSTSMISFEIQSQYQLDPEWHTIWTTSEDLTSVEELVRTLGLYRRNHPDVLFRLVKTEIIG